MLDIVILCQMLGLAHGDTQYKAVILHLFLYMHLIFLKEHDLVEIMCLKLSCYIESKLTPESGEGVLPGTTDN